MRCSLCGAKIRPWFEVCFECYNPISKNIGKIPVPIVTKDFMKNMGVDSWK